MKISPNWPYEDQNKYWAVFCLSKVKKQVAEKELQRRTSLYYFCFLPPSWGVPRRFCLSKLTGKSASDLPRPVCALKDKRTLTVGGGKNPRRLPFSLPLLPLPLLLLPSLRFTNIQTTLIKLPIFFKKK